MARSSSPAGVSTRARMPVPAQVAHVAGAHVGVARDSPNVTVAPGKAAHPGHHARIVGRAHEHVAGPRALEDLGLGVGNRVHRREEAHVGVAHVGPHADVGLGNAHERADLPGVIHPQFHHRHVRPARQLQQRERQADVVVQVPLVLHHPEPRGQQGRNRFLGRGLARASRDRHHLRARRLPHRVRQVLQRRQRVGDADRLRRHARPRDARPAQACSTTTPAAPSASASAANVWPSNRGPAAPRTRRRPPSTGCRSRRREPASATPPARQPSSPATAPAIQPSVSATALTRPPTSADARSALRAPPPRRRTERSCRRSPGTSRAPCRRPAPRRPRRPPRRPDESPRADRRSSAPWHCSAALPVRLPRITSSMICAGSSPRGLSDVITTTSLSRAATIPINGRLVRSRSPPAPKTVTSRRVAMRPRRLEQVAQRVVGVRVVDDDGDVVARARHHLEPARHAGEAGDAALDGVERNADRRGDADGGQDVVDVGPADERRPHAHGALRRPHVEGQAVERERRADPA